MSRLTVRFVAFFLLFGAILHGQSFEEEDPKLKWALRPLAFRHPIPYFISEPVLEHDAELGRWAIEAWETASNGVICVYPSEAAHAWLRIYWSGVPTSRLGLMQSILVDGRRGAEIYVRGDGGGPLPELSQWAAADPLFRDVMVFITLVHEIGHGLGLVHSVSMKDVMYFGGEPVEYYEQYRRRIERREDLKRLDVLSADDLSRLREMYEVKAVVVPRAPKK